MKGMDHSKLGEHSPQDELRTDASSLQTDIDILVDATKLFHSLQ